MNRLPCLSAAVVFALMSTGLHAATVMLTPGSATVQQGGNVSFDLVADFGDSRIAIGATDIEWDPSVLELSGFNFGDGLAARDIGRVIPMDSSGVTIAFASFDGLELGPSSALGTLSFHAVGGPGSSTAITLSDNDNVGYVESVVLPLGGVSSRIADIGHTLVSKASDSIGGKSQGSFDGKSLSDKLGDFSGKFEFSDDKFGKLDNGFNTIDVDYTGATVEITAVPLPAAGWLLLSALGGLAGMRLRHSCRAA